MAVRDEDVRYLWAQEAPDEVIAQMLSCSPHTVEHHRKKMKLKKNPPPKKPKTYFPVRRAEKQPERCKTCFYAGKLGSDPCCDYTLIVGHSRGCKAGDGCTVYKPRRVKHE